uniref:Aminotransferase-like plant mobile domain-containing protein n=1 Tax=Fagus sylvatica TaxID=28930 RepID=A0A2N9HWC3_FAGSY
MAKSSSNSDPCSRATQIIEALPASQRITGILIPCENTQTSSASASTSPRCGLGPSFSSFPEDLSPIFPCHSHLASIYQNRQMNLGEWDMFTTSVTWYKLAPSWSAWVARVALSKLDKWKTLGINEAIRASKYEMPINSSLPDDDVDILNGVSLSYNEFNKQMKGSDTLPVSYKEKCCFYLFWICRFLACTSSKWVINYYLPIARCLANDVPVDMSSFLLGELYRAMFLLNTEPKQSHGGPVWLIQMYPTEVPSFPTCFKLFSDSSRRRLPEEFMPFEAKKYGSEDFHEFSSQGFFRGDTAWGACLQSRDLVVIRSANAGVLPGFLLYQRTGAGIEHIASYVTPQPLQQISPSEKKVGGDPSSQKFVTAEVSSDPLINLVDIVTDRVIAHHAELAEMAFDLRNQLMKLLAPSEQRTRTSTKRKTPPKVKEVNTAISPKGAKPSGKRLIKTIAKKSTNKKAKVVEVVLDSSIIEVEPLEDELDDFATLSNLLAAAFKAKAKVEDAERKRLEAEVEKKKQADKVEEERIAKIKKRRKAEQVVPREARLTKQTAVATVVSVQQVAQPAIEVRTWIEAATSSIKAVAPLCQTPTKTSSTPIPLEPSKDQLQAAIDQLRELLQKPVGLVLLDARQYYFQPPSSPREEKLSCQPGSRPQAKSLQVASSPT